MTGLPALGPTHEDQDIWELVAFIRKLPKVEPKEYKALMAAAGIKEATAAGHSHDDGDVPALETGTDERA